jgi:membrane fusion protein, copper/silver efflux system
MHGNNRLLVAIGFALTLVAGAGIGYWAAQHRLVATPDQAAPATPPVRKVLYWYDPMMPTQHFDRPGKSPFMDMQLVPKYADEAVSAADDKDLQIDPIISHNLGVRVVPVRTGVLQRELLASGTVAFNARDVAVVQTRTAGYVERVYPHAPGDEVAHGAALVDLLVPEWLAAQQEALAVAAMQDPNLTAAARSRLQQLGMTRVQIDSVLANGKPAPTITIRAPLAGVLSTLDVRTGMTLAAGTTLATINGLDPLWLEVAVPEAASDAVVVGRAVRVEFPAFPGEVIAGTIAAILNDTDLATHTLRVRVELPNPSRRLKVGLSARIAIVPSTEETAVLVPAEAVIRTGTRTFVMREQAPGNYRAVAVELGREGDGEIEIRAGLKADDRIVASGQFLFDSEASLRGRVDAEAVP